MGSCNAFIKGVALTLRMLDGYGKKLTDFEDLGVSKRQLRRYLNKMVSDGYAKKVTRGTKAWWKLIVTKPTKIKRAFKFCSKCPGSLPKSIYEFPENRYSPDGHGNICYPCLARLRSEQIDRVGRAYFNRLQRKNYRKRKMRLRRKARLAKSVIIEA
jgi:hypothetical protein